MPKTCKYNDKQIIENILAIAKDLNRTPFYSEYMQHPLRICGIDTIKKRFGSYLSLVKMAGLKHQYHTDQEILDNLKAIADDLGHVPTLKEYANHPLRIIHPYRITERFGKWLNVCEKAGIPMTIENMQYRQMNTYLRNKKENKKEKILRDKLLKELYDAMLSHPGVSIFTAIEKYTHASRSMYDKYFGNIGTVRKCLKNEYGLNAEQRYQKHIKWTKPILEKEFKRIAQLVGRRPSHADILKHTIYRNISHGIEEVFGTYNALVTSAGYNPYYRKLTEENKKKRRQQYIAVLQKVALKEKTENWTLQDFYNACHITKERMRPLFSNSKDWFKAARIPIPKSLMLYGKNEGKIKNGKKVYKDYTDI